MSTNPLFADSSSDEEDESPPAAPQEKATTEEAEAPANDDDNAEDKASAKMDDGDSADNAAKEEGGESKSRLVIGDESDDEEGDAEFDDQGGIVGSSSPRAKTSTDAPAETPGDMDTGKTSKSINKPPESATVLQTDRPSEGVSLHMTKLPNLVAIQPAAFDEGTYLEKEEENQYKGYVHNMIRWRYKTDDSGEMVRDGSGNLVRESNSKLVKWEDGSYTLHIGTEAFNIQNIDSSSNGFAGLNGYIYLSQKATFDSEGGDGEGPGGTVLECVGPVASRLVPEPSSLQSQAHKSLTVAVRQRTIKRAKIAEFVTQEDPEKLKQDRIKTNQEEDKIRARKKSAYRSTASRHRMPGMNRRYMEEDDDADYDTTNISAMKKGTMEDDMDDYGDDSDDGYDDTFNKRTRKRQRKAVEEEEDEEELVFGDEDDEDDVAMKAPSKKKRPHQNVFDDDDSD